MKLNRNIAFIAALLGTVAAANAQSFELRGAGLTGTTFVVAPGTGSLTVEVWYIPGATPLPQWNGLNLMLGHGSALNNSVTTNSNSPLTFTTGSFVNNVASFGMGQLGTTKTKGGTTPAAGTNNPVGGTGSAAVRPFVVELSLGNLANQVGPTTATRIGTFSFGYTMANGDIFGDSGTESGLIVYRTTAAGLGSIASGGVNSGMQNNPSTGSQRLGSAKYSVQAVPEPGTMAAIAAGVAAMAARRRKNSKA